jgi:hypothetical protein
MFSHQLSTYSEKEIRKERKISRAKLSKLTEASTKLFIDLPSIIHLSKAEANCRRFF